MYLEASGKLILCFCISCFIMMFRLVGCRFETPEPFIYVVIASLAKGTAISLAIGSNSLPISLAIGYTVFPTFLIPLNASSKKFPPRVFLGLPGLFLIAGSCIVSSRIISSTLSFCFLPLFGLSIPAANNKGKNGAAVFATVPISSHTDPP